MERVYRRVLISVIALTVMGYGHALAADAGLKVFVEKRCYTCHTSAGWDSGRGAGGGYDLPSSPILATGSVQPGGSNHHPARWCDSEARREAARSGARTRGARADAKRP